MTTFITETLRKKFNSLKAQNNWRRELTWENKDIEYLFSEIDALSAEIDRLTNENVALRKGQDMLAESYDAITKTIQSMTPPTYVPEPPASAPSAAPASETVASETTDWCARQLNGDDGWVGNPEGIALRDCTMAGVGYEGAYADPEMFDGQPEYRAEPPVNLNVPSVERSALAIQMLDAIAEDLSVTDVDAPASAPSAAQAKVVKLTKAMVQALTAIVEISALDTHWQKRQGGVYLPSTRSLSGSIEVSGATVKSLLNRKLIEKVGSYYRVYRITPAGKAALS